MGSLGPVELLIIMAIALVVFGPKKLPEIGRSLGNALREFNRARSEFMDSIQHELDRPEPAYSEPTSAPTASAGESLPAPAPRSLEYPQPLEAEAAEALPYGAEFYAAEGDSQPAFRTAQPESAPATTAASAGAPTGEGKA